MLQVTEAQKGKMELRHLEKHKAYSYIRFSTPEQERGDSLRRQTEAAESYALAHGLELVDASYQDLGVSAYRGANADTGKLAEFMEAVRREAITPGSYLLIESMDRLSRAKPRRAMELLGSICDAGITVVTLADGKVYDEKTLDDDPMAFMWAFMVAMRANEESLTKSNRLKASWENKRAKATERPLTSIVPAWLRLDKNTNTFEVIEDRVRIVQRVFEMTLDGVGQHRIAEALNADRTPCFGGASFWHRSYVSKLLENPAVIGTLVPRKIEITADGKRRRKALEPITGYFPAIVPPEDFKAVMAMQNDRKAPIVKGTQPLQNLFAGLAVCPLCGSTMTRVYKGDKKRAGKPKLVCTRAKVGAGCEYHSVDLEALESTMTFHADRIVGELPLAGEDLTDKVENANIALGLLLDEAREIARELIQSPSPTLRARLVAVEGNAAEAETRLQELLKEQEVSSPIVLKARLEELRKALQEEPLNREKANAALRAVMKKVIINYQKGELDFVWKNGATTDLWYAPKFDEVKQ